MTNFRILASVAPAMALAATSCAAHAQPPSQPPSNSAAPVTIDNYNRAQTDVYFAGTVKAGTLGQFKHGRELAPIVNRGIVRGNRDTLYSFAVFDFDAGPVTITLPDPGHRFMVMQVVNEDQYTPAVFYDAGTYTLTREGIGTRYAMVVVRMVLDPANPQDAQQIHALQDKLTVSQRSPGTFEVPNWDETSLKKVRTALLQLGETVSDTRRMFGAKADHVDPMRHLIGTALIWGGLPEKDGLYLPITPERNDGTTVHTLTVKDVPVDGFWSVTVYNAEGYLESNAYNTYSVSKMNAKAGADGSVTIRFGGCDGKIPNCLPIMKGWNYTVRLFRPRTEILDGAWKFPKAHPEG
ncbi:DUF1254 domain-containing protein [Pendulispora rubella]|uniref:DUF1254 domain-containing protein n=1 Tax=Pendulispora rubella TaxID=2741070 RepID=A0ABZ2KR78_9BACT